MGHDLPGSPEFLRGSHFFKVDQVCTDHLGVLSTLFLLCLSKTVDGFCSHNKEKSLEKKWKDIWLKSSSNQSTAGPVTMSSLSKWRSFVGGKRKANLPVLLIKV